MKPGPERTERPEATWRLSAMILAGLMLATAAVYWPVRQHSFLNYDDPDYVTRNLYVRAGLTEAGIVWAFANIAGERTYWHPLTWLSHMLDCQLFGLNAGAHHLVNLAFHLANVALLFLVLRRMTKALWPSGIVAALFALHPLQVDTVAWITERKNLLSTLFGLLALWAYASYAEGRRKNAECRMQNAKSRNTQHASRSLSSSLLDPPPSSYYLLSLLFFALSLMSKPALVTLPFVLLLLDYWPLHRLRLKSQVSSLKSLGPLLWDKLPFVALSAASCAITLAAHHRLQSLASPSALPLVERVANAVISYVRYLGKVFWPGNLAVFYPHSGACPLWQVASAILLLLGLSILVIWWRRRYPWLAVGWFWFLGTLVPVIGLIQAGQQAMADRFAYVPMIGLCLGVVFGVTEAAKRVKWAIAAKATLAGLTLAGCLALCPLQLRHWQNTETLFRHAIAVTRGNHIAYLNLGLALQAEGKLDQALACYSEVFRLKPHYPDAHNNCGVALQAQGKLDQAIQHFEQALALRPDFSEALNNLGVAVGDRGGLAEAVSALTRAVQLNPRYADAHANLGRVLRRQGKAEAAVSAYRQAIALQDDLPDAHNALGFLLATRGEVEGAIRHFRKALHYRPEFSEALSNLGGALLVQSRAAEAVAPLARAIQLKPDYADAHYNLGNALVQLGRTREALAEYQTVLRLKPAHAAAHYRAGNLMLAENDAGSAGEHYRAALAANSNYPEAHCQLAGVLVQGREVEQGIKHYREALRLKPDWVEPLRRLAWLLATHPEAKYRDSQEAVRLATQAVELAKEQDPEALDTLAAAYAEAGRFPEAVQTAQAAAAEAGAAAQTNLASRISARLKLYQAGSPYRESAP